MEGRCKDCKWWRSYFERMVCDRIGSLPDMPPERSFFIQATVADDQGLDVHLVTGPEFGCVHFEQKRTS